MEKQPSTENLDSLGHSDIEKLSLEEASRELRSRLNGAERGVVEMDSKKFTTTSTSNDDLLYIIKLQNPEATKEFLEKTKEGREVLYKKASKYLIDLWDKVFEENANLFTIPTKGEVLEKISGLSEDFSSLSYEAHEVLDKNLSTLMHELSNDTENIYGKLHFDNRGPDNEEVSGVRFRQYYSFVKKLQAAVLALKASRLE